MKQIFNKITIGLSYVLMVVLGLMPVKAISAEDQAVFDQILHPILRIYDFVKYAATVVAALFLVFAAISYMTSGNDAKKRDNNKFMIGSILFGLVIIWATPFLINFILGQ